MVQLEEYKIGIVYARDKTPHRHASLGGARAAKQLLVAEDACGDVRLLSFLQA